MRGDQLRLLEALEQIDLIATFASHGRDAFLNDLLVQSAILHRLALLGEACRGVSAELREAHPAVPWQQIIGFRNVVIHEYFGIDLELVWAIAADHVANLRSQIEEILATLPGPKP